MVLKSQRYYEIKDSTRLVLLIGAQVLAYTNSCINPILYAFLSENFRKAFLKVIACKRADYQNVATSRATLAGGPVSNTHHQPLSDAAAGGGGGVGGATGSINQHQHHHHLHDTIAVDHKSFAGVEVSGLDDLIIII